MLNKNIKPFIMHITSFSLNLMLIHLVSKAQITLLVIKKVQILFKYSDFSDVFLKKKSFDLTKGNQLKLILHQISRKLAITL